MTIDEFMTNNTHLIIEEVLSLVEKEFDSHEFIRKFSKQFDNQYVNFLSCYHGKHHQNVHKQIARNLQKNQSRYGIMDCGKVLSVNCFGEINTNELWRKI